MKKWTCYEIANSGSGPLKSRRKIECDTSVDAAQKMASILWRKESAEPGNGDEKWIAVERLNSPGQFSVYRVACVVFREYPVYGLGSLTKKEINQKKAVAS